MDGQVPKHCVPVAEVQALGRVADEDALTARSDAGDGGDLALEFPQAGPTGQPLQNVGATLGLAAEPPHRAGRPASCGASFGPSRSRGGGGDAAATAAAGATSGGDPKMAAFRAAKHREK